MQRTITYRNTINGALTDVSSIVLRDPTATYGVKRNDTNGVIVAAGTPLTRVALGTYQYVFQEPANNLTFDYWIERVYNGNTKRTKQTLQGTVSGAVGVVPVAPAAYVTLGVTTVACGDVALTEFLNTQANLVWAMQACQPTLDLRYQHFVLGLIDLALDFVRALTDTDTSTEQLQATGYANSDMANESVMESSRLARGSSTQNASSTQTATRAASRSSLSSMNASSTQTSRRDGSGSDASTQTQTLDNTHTGQRHLKTTTTPYLKTTNDQFVNSRLFGEGAFANTNEGGTIHNISIAIPFIGDLRGQTGRIDQLADYNRSQSEMRSDSNGIIESTHRMTVVTVGLPGENFDTQTTEGEGERINAISRTSTSSMTGSATSTSTGSMTSTSHDESHRAASSTSHAESNSHAESVGSGSSHRTGQGASSLVSSGVSNHQYYSQIFESLQKMWDNTKSQIEKLEQQVLMPSRVVIKRLATRTPRNALTVGNVRGNDFITGNPFGTPFARTIR